MMSASKLTDRCKIRRVRKQYSPFVTDPLVEIDVSLSSLSTEIRCYAAQSEPWLLFVGRRCERPAEECGVRLGMLTSKGVI